MQLYAGCGEISGDYGFGIDCGLDLSTERAVGKVCQLSLRILSFVAVRTRCYERKGGRWLGRSGIY